MTPDPRYVGARCVLLDALEALQDHLNAVVVVGAQAVYLRAGHTNVGVADYTTDGDLVIDATVLAERPLLDDVMGTLFTRAEFVRAP